MCSWGNCLCVDFNDATTEDILLVKIEEVAQLTCSELGKQTLTYRQKQHQKIIKVFLRDYKRVFVEQKKEKKEASRVGQDQQRT
ncbi:hypothetical protein L3Y34_011432 [Caenorhabditis briggsae]|uniref:Uncharacterized protein n=1 Tax=Caenorhabditis briggsae TaxID=6238 RepID=A0AAE8ZWA4_CAEBR|nr:hypothetical protein L3Y34_011432 [Caenorhabditis briggsae]